jgi:hypothetical protein
MIDPAQHKVQRMALAFFNLGYGPVVPLRPAVMHISGLFHATHLFAMIT